jgi:ABC-type amino acid transport substrate-binding protein
MSQTAKTILISILVSIAVVFTMVNFFMAHRAAPEAVAVKESAYDRVIRTKILRCGYGTWKPGVYKAENNQMTGLFAELTEAMGKLSGIKIEWTAETDWGQIPQAINSGKIDAFCSGMANDAARGKFLAYTNPVSYWTFDALVRADDARFPADTASNADLNKVDFSSAYSEGDVLETIVKNEFPNVKGVPLPPLGTPADNLMYVLTGKTDFVIFPKIMYQMYEKENPGKLKLVKIDPPLRAYGNVIAIGIDDLKLQQLLNASVNELVNSGMYNEIMRKYDEQYPGAFLRVAKQYQ